MVEEHTQEEWGDPMESLETFRQDVLDGKLDPRIALECFLLVKLEIRPAAIVTVPAELPGGEILGAQVDYEFRSRVAGQARDVKTRLADAIERRRQKPLAFKTFVLRSSFANNISRSGTFIAHREAARSLGLEVQESEVRPTIQEWYVSLAAHRFDVADMLHGRRHIQKNQRTQFKPGDPVAYYIYPEERDPDHLRALGRLLGYPDCCVEAYLAGRLADGDQGESIPEERAARQITATTSPEAFWVKDFFPCRPDCPAAKAKGRAAREALAGVAPAFGQLYDGFRLANLARVRSGPESIRRHEDWLLKR